MPNKPNKTQDNNTMTRQNQGGTPNKGTNENMTRERKDAGKTAGQTNKNAR